MVAVLTTIVGASCGSPEAGPLTATDPPQAPTAPEQDTTHAPFPAGPSDTATTSDSATTDTAAGLPTPVSYTGLPFGPTGLWTANRLNGTPEPFTGSQNYISADTVVLQISAARAAGQRLVLAMAGGGYDRYTTNGQFDMTKWKARMDTYRDPVIQAAVAAAVADGTVIGNLLIDEPETKRWGTVLTKDMIDEMATYAKQIFPTLPMGVDHGPPGYRWGESQRYHVLDYVLYQYAHYITMGDVVAWRNTVLHQASLDGVTPMLSINVLNGGAQDRKGAWDCTDKGQAGVGTYAPNCHMTPDQIREFGKALTPYGCYMMLWRYDAAYMSDPANQEAFKELAALAASTPRRSCKRP
jgi:hypothetical protein